MSRSGATGFPTGFAQLAFFVASRFFVLELAVEELDISFGDDVGFFNVFEVAVLEADIADLGGGKANDVQDARSMGDIEVFDENIAGDRFIGAVRTFFIDKVNLEDGVFYAANLTIAQENVFDDAPA